jgi:hypothetical protein
MAEAHVMRAPQATLVSILSMIMGLSGMAACSGAPLTAISTAPDGGGEASSDASGSANTDVTSAEGSSEAPPDDALDADTSAQSLDAATEATLDGSASETSDAASESSDQAAPEAGAVDANDGQADGVGPADAPPEAADASSECTASTFYLDGDGDHYGGTTTFTGCTPPSSGTWVQAGGDCDDSNPTVNPGQKAFFAQGYVPTGKTAVSFDYDCNGTEDESGSSPKENCVGSALSCVGSGYVVATPVRSGSGVDPYCGSDKTATCAVVALVCKESGRQSATPISCR